MSFNEQYSKLVCVADNEYITSQRLNVKYIYNIRSLFLVFNDIFS